MPFMFHSHPLDVPVLRHPSKSASPMDGCVRTVHEHEWLRHPSKSASPRDGCVRTVHEREWTWIVMQWIADVTWIPKLAVVAMDKGIGLFI